MNFAIIGLGFVSPRHIKGIERSGGKVILTCDIDENKKLEGIPSIKHYKEMREHPLYKDIDVISICVPNYLHHDIIQGFPDKQIICEKPTVIDPNHWKDIGDNVSCVMQLRFNSKVRQLKDTNIQSPIDITVQTYREPSYFESWKGDSRMSGGILYNMGVHYIDLLIYLLGEPVKIIKSDINSKSAIGLVEFEHGLGRFSFELLTTKTPTVIRKMKIGEDLFDLNGATIPLSKKNDIPDDDLHTELYREYVKGNKIPFSEALKSLKLIEQLKKHADKT